MLFHVNTILADFYWCFHEHDIQIALQNICNTYWRYTVTQILANKITITTFSLVAVKLVPVKYGINLKAAMGIFANRYGIKTINQS